MTTPALRSARRVLPILALTAALVAAAPATATASTLLHWYKGDHNALDSAGASNGSFGPDKYVAGHDGEAFNVNVGITNEYVDIPSDPSFYPSGSFSVDAWVSTTVATGTGTVVTLDESSGTPPPPGTPTNSAWRIGVIEGKPYAFVRDSDAGGLIGDDGGQLIKSGRSIADGSFHKLALIKDVEAGRLSLYVDGIAVGEQLLAAGASGALRDDDHVADPVTIGARLGPGSNNPNFEFSGAIDDVRYFDGAEYPDKTPPAITVQVLGDSTDGWFTSDLTSVRWTILDESVIRSSSGCADVDLSDDTAGTTVTCTATSAGGTSTQSVTVKRDATGPVLACSPNQTRFVKGTKVTITGTVTDALTGVASPTVSAVADTLDKGPHSVVLSARDLVGNRGSIPCPYDVYVPVITKTSFVRVATAKTGCVKRRRLSILVKLPAKPAVVKAEVFLGDKLLKSVTGAKLKSPVALSKLPKKGSYRITVQITDTNGNQRIGTRKFKACHA